MERMMNVSGNFSYYEHANVDESTKIHIRICLEVYVVLSELAFKSFFLSSKATIIDYLGASMQCLRIYREYPFVRMSQELIFPLYSAALLFRGLNHYGYVKAFLFPR